MADEGSASGLGKCTAELLAAANDLRAKRVWTFALVRAKHSSTPSMSQARLLGPIARLIAKAYPRTTCWPASRSIRSTAPTNGSSEPLLNNCDRCDALYASNTPISARLALEIYRSSRAPHWIFPNSFSRQDVTAEPFVPKEIPTFPS